MKKTDNWSDKKYMGPHKMVNLDRSRLSLTRLTVMVMTV